METEALTIDGIPLLVCYGDRETALSKGTILFYHGLGASKDVQFKDLSSLAEHGYFVVGVDNVGHGDRRFADFDARFSPENPNVELEFTKAVRDTALEVLALVDAIIARDMVREGRLGICGISMGGFITYSALTLEPRLRVAAPMLGSPKWKVDLPGSPHTLIERFRDVALLSQTSGIDDIVPPDNARAFHKALDERFPDRRDRHVYIEYPESNHFMREEDWTVAWGRLVAWFDRFLAGAQ